MGKLTNFFGWETIATAIGITMIGPLVDAPATMLNAIGDNVSSMLVARILGGKDWMKEV